MSKDSKNNPQERLIWLDSLVEVIKERTGLDLNDLQIAILKGAYNNECYDRIASKYGCSKDHAKRVGSSLWSLLSTCFGQVVDKRNVKVMLDRFKQELYLSQQDRLEPPVGVVPSDSKFYVERLEIESLCLQAIVRKGGLIKISAPAKMGKSSLMRRIIKLAEGCRGVCLDLNLSERKILTNLDRFLKWLSLSVARELKLPPNLEEYWDDDLGCKSSCSFYFEEYLLASTDLPLILALDKLDYLFASEEIAIDFFTLLRAWHENSKVDPKWSKLRLILVYDDNPPSVESNKSPFNVGLTVSQLEFSAAEVLDLARRYGLSWFEVEVNRLISALSEAAPLAIGTHPYLVRQALYEITTQEISLNQFLQQDLTKLSPYRDYLSS